MDADAVAALVGAFAIMVALTALLCHDRVGARPSAEAGAAEYVTLEDLFSRDLRPAHLVDRDATGAEITASLDELDAVDVGVAAAPDVATEFAEPDGSAAVEAPGEVAVATLDPDGVDADESVVLVELPVAEDVSIDPARCASSTKSGSRCTRKATETGHCKQHARGHETVVPVAA